MEVLLGITGKDFTIIASSKAAVRGFSSGQWRLKGQVQQRPLRLFEYAYTHIFTHTYIYTAPFSGTRTGKGLGPSRTIHYGS